MITFKQFLQNLLESRHKTDDPEEINRLVNLPHGEAVTKNTNHPNFDGRIAQAVHHFHSDDDEEVERVLDHNSRHPFSWVRAHVAKNKHVHRFPHIVQRLQNDPQKRVKETIESSIAKQQGGTSAAPAPKPKKLPTPKPTVVKVKPPKEKEEPKEKKPAGSFSVEQGDKEDFAYSTQVSHVKDHKGRKVGSVVSVRIPSEYGQDRVHHIAYSGNHERGNIKELGSSFENHVEAMKALGKHLKGN